MGQVLHGNATTTAAIRRATQNSQESLIKLSKRFGINPKTVDKWRKKNSVEDLKAGPKNPRSTVLSVEEEAIIVAYTVIHFCLLMIVSTSSSLLFLA